MKLSAQDEVKLAEAIGVAIGMNSSPTKGQGDVHGGQRGYIVYQSSGLPYVIADIIRAVEQLQGPKRVMQPWTNDIPYMQQTVLLTAVRGPDGIPKYASIKYLLRWYRRCILMSSLDGCVITNPYDDRGGSFMGPSFKGYTGEDSWQACMNKIVDEYIQSLDGVPHHFQLHFMHAVEIVGYHHPDTHIRVWFNNLYVRLVDDMHLHYETQAELDARLNDTRAGWLARADKATIT